MLKHPRKLRNYLVTPGFQLRFSLYFIVSGLAVIGVLVAIIFSRLRELSTTISQSGSLSLQAQSQLNDMIFDVTWGSLFVFIGFSLVVLFYSIIISHRIAGPVVAICAYIEDLKKGNYDATRTLRKYDELHPIMDSLQEFAAQLKSGSKSTGQ